MTSKKHARSCRFRSLFGTVAVVAGVAACEQESGPGASSPSRKDRQPDKTEVKMEKMEMPSDPAPASTGIGGLGSGPTSSVAITTTQNVGTDPADDPNIGGRQEPVIDKALSPIRPMIGKCYKKAQSAEPNIGGNTTFDVTLDRAGKVTNVRFVKRDGLNDDLVGCLQTAIKKATFEPVRQTQIVTFTFGNAPPPAAAPAPAADAGAGPKR